RAGPVGRSTIPGNAGQSNVEALRRGNCRQPHECRVTGKPGYLCGIYRLMERLAHSGFLPRSRKNPHDGACPSWGIDIRLPLRPYQSITEIGPPDSVTVAV